MLSALFDRGIFLSDPREGRPKTSTDDQNVALVEAAVKEDGRITIQQLEENLGIDATSIWRILTQTLGYTRKCSRWIPHLTQEQKEARVKFCKIFLKKFRDGVKIS